MASLPMQPYSSSVLTCCWLLLLATPHVTWGNLLAANKDGDIQSLLRAWGPVAEVAGDHGHSQDSILWGLADAKATVGKLFSYAIPKQAFKGQVDAYKVTEVGKTDLPSWLTFNTSTNTLRGLPMPSDLNLQVYIEVTAMRKYPNETRSDSKDMFGINVLTDNIHSDTGAMPLKELASGQLQPIKCPAGSSVTMATVVVDADPDALSVNNKLGLMEGLCQHLGMPVGVARLLPAGNKPLFDSSALVAGPGDVKLPEHAGVLLEWEVGCGNVQAVHMPILTRLEATSHDGSMSGAGGHGIVGWHVTNNRPQTAKRFKRQVRVVPTPTPEVSKIVRPTGRPIATVTVTDGVAPTTRDVPTMESPTFTQIQPTSSSSTKKTRHRTKTRTRTRSKTRTSCRHCHKTKKPKPSPAVTSTSAADGIASTDSRDLIRPTNVLEPASSIEPSISHLQPSLPVSSPGLTRSLEVIEPSMTMTYTSSQMTSSTEILPTRSYDVVDVISTAPIQPSRTHDLATTTTHQSTSNDHKPTTTTTKPLTKPSLTTTTTPFDENIDEENSKPIIMQYISPIQIDQGKILSHKIPAGTFNDHVDGNTRNLGLMLMAPDGLSLEPSSWIKLNEMTQTLYGLPMELDVGSHELLLAAIDSDSKVARLVFEVDVKEKPRRQNNHEFALTLNITFDLFRRDVKMRIDIAERLSRLYGDADASNIQVTRIDRGSVVYAWTNSTLPYNPCPKKEILQLQRRLMHLNSTITADLIEAMKPHQILKVESIMLGRCQGADLPVVESTPSAHDKNKVKELPPVSQPASPPVTPSRDAALASSTGENSPADGGVVVEPQETNGEDILITTVVPAVVIGAVLILAVIIACILYRKQRKVKLSNIDQHTFITKGIPIIFAEELDDRPEQATKPLILEDEKPPLPPPEYPGSSMSGSQLSTPRSDHKQLLFDTDTEGEMTPYQPPGPPMTGSLRGNRARNNQQPTYRNPPPYVPP